MQNQPFIVCQLQNITTQVSVEMQQKPRPQEQKLAITNVSHNFLPYKNMTYLICDTKLIYDHHVIRHLCTDDAAQTKHWFVQSPSSAKQSLRDNKHSSSHQQPQDRFQRYSREIAVSLVPHYAVCAISHTTTMTTEMWTFGLTAHAIQMRPLRPRVSNSNWHSVAAVWQPRQRSQATDRQNWGTPRLPSNGSRGLSAQKLSGQGMKGRSPPSSAKIKKVWSCTSSPTYGFTICTGKLHL
jgi:hypothetical protein